ncbi:MAG: helix-turn-helix domain-containing protein [Gammaproteobacteria bacterium]|nr:helix-turn-helix domain-containing protein [Gammaproteobacteria bacterium]
MSIIYLNWAFSLPITGPAKAVLIALADRADDAGFCYPSMTDLAKRSGLSSRSVIRAVDKLSALDKIEIVRQKGVTNHYFLKAKLSTETSDTNDTVPPDKSYPQATTRQEPVTDCRKTSDRVSYKPSKEPPRTKEMRARETGDKTTPATMSHASFQTWTPAATAKAERKTASGELRSIKSILGARP